MEKEKVDVCLSRRGIRGDYIRSDSRACRLIFRVKDNGLQITCPEGYAVNRVKSAVDDNREKLRVLVSRSVTIRKNRVLSTGDSIPCYGGDICLLRDVVE